MSGRINIKTVAGALLCSALAMAVPVSCDINEGLEPCPRGVELRFVFDYNMEYANAFPSKVDCYTLYVYDEQGNYVNSFSETGDVLQDEAYRLKIDLPLGRYRFIAYGGMNCADRSFDFVRTPGEGSRLSDLEVLMHTEGRTSACLLHDHFYGSLEVAVEGDRYSPQTIHLMRNTNSVRVFLQHLNGDPIPVEKFSFSIEDDNTRFDSGNNRIPNGRITYLPWAKGLASSRSGSEPEVTAGYAEFSTSRLYAKPPEGAEGNRLLVHVLSDDIGAVGTKVLSIPLSKYLGLAMSDKYREIGRLLSPQEYLDRESEWTLTFFLDSRYKWIHTQIIVNGWVIRLNDGDLT